MANSKQQINDKLRDEISRLKKTITDKNKLLFAYESVRAPVYTEEEVSEIGSLKAENKTKDEQIVVLQRKLEEIISDNVTAIHQIRRLLE